MLGPTAFNFSPERLYVLGVEAEVIEGVRESLNVIKSITVAGQGLDFGKGEENYQPWQRDALMQARSLGTAGRCPILTSRVGHGNVSQGS